MRKCSLVVLLSGLWGLASCNAVLGIEPLKVSRIDAGSQDADTPPQTSDAGGSDSSAGSGGHGGAPAGSGGGAGSRADSGGHGGAGGHDGGAGGAEAGSGGAHDSGGTGGSVAGSGGGSAAGSGGGSDTVHGRVIDYRRHPLPNVTVRIGDDTTQTDTDGKFSVDAVAASYDITLTISANVLNAAARFAWQVQGLTRRDPTVQVYRGLPSRSATTMITVNNVTFPLASAQRIQMTWASPDGSFDLDLDAMMTNYLSPAWVGPTSSVGTAHAVLFNVAGSPELPISYTAHSAQPLTLQDSMNDIPVAFDLSSQSLTTGNITGSVTGQSNNRENRVYLRFADNSALELISDSAASGNFSYVVPNIPNAAFTVAAEDQNNGRDQGITAAYVDNVTPGQTGIALSLPEIPVLNAPGAGKTNVDGNTLFQWASSAKVFLFCASSNDNYDKACVLTTKKETKLPLSPISDFTPATNSSYYWSVSVHGDYASTDATADPDGYLSAYTNGTIDGPARGSGSYADSAAWGFTTAP